MTDVVEIAKERQARLAAEIGKLDDFIRMAEALLKQSLSKSSKASDTEDEKAAGGNGAEAEREDLPVRELKAEELVRNLRTIHNEPAPDRWEHFSFRETA
ncbi:MAG: hypothetical protein V3S07_09040 [Micropepsaceae bacterium]